MPALLPRAHHALKAACEPAALATRSLAGTGTSTLRARGLPATTINPQPLRPARASSSSSSQRWKTRQTSDPYTKSSKLSTLKSRAAYKLLEINDKHKLFKAGQSVVDLGYAPGSWSQVAKNRVGESGRVVGIDVIPAQPPRGVSAMQGNFLAESVQERVRGFVREWKEGAREEGQEESVLEAARAERVESTLAEDAEPVVQEVEVEKKASKKQTKKLSAKALDLQEGRVVDVVLSDMCAPFPGLELSSWINSVNRPYRRMMNTSGNPFRDHAGSIVRGPCTVIKTNQRKAWNALTL